MDLWRFKLSSLNSEKFLLVLILSVSVGFNVYLAQEIKNQRNIWNLLEADKAEHEITLGKRVSTLSAQDHTGQSISISHDPVKPTVLYVYSPDCVWCERNVQNIVQLYDIAKNEYNFVGLSIAKSDSEFVDEQNEFSFPVFFNPSDRSRLEYNIRSTPSTYVISPEGKIIKFWSGAYSDKLRPDVEKFFSVRLPGLTE